MKESTTTDGRKSKSATARVCVLKRRDIDDDPHNIPRPDALVGRVSKSEWRMLLARLHASSTFERDYFKMCLQIIPLCSLTSWLIWIMSYYQRWVFKCWLVMVIAAFFLPLFHLSIYWPSKVQRLSVPWKPYRVRVKVEQNKKEIHVLIRPLKKSEKVKKCYSMPVKIDVKRRRCDTDVHVTLGGLPDGVLAHRDGDDEFDSYHQYGAPVKEDAKQVVMEWFEQSLGGLRLLGPTHYMRALWILPFVATFLSLLVLFTPISHYLSRCIAVISQTFLMSIVFSALNRPFFESFVEFCSKFPIWSLDGYDVQLQYSCEVLSLNFREKTATEWEEDDEESTDENLFLRPRYGLSPMHSSPEGQESPGDDDEGDFEVV